MFSLWQIAFRRRQSECSIAPPGATTPSLAHIRWLYVEHFDERGIDLFRAVCERDLEGIVAKRKDGMYTPEETSWVKIKNPQYSQIEGRHELFETRAAGA